MADVGFARRRCANGAGAVLRDQGEDASVLGPSMIAGRLRRGAPLIPEHLAQRAFGPSSRARITPAGCLTARYSRFERLAKSISNPYQEENCERAVVAKGVELLVARQPPK